MSAITPQAATIGKPRLLARALGLGLVAGVCANWLGLPLPWMLGPLLATMVVSLGGFQLAVPRSLRITFRGTIGLLLGSAIDHETLSRVGQWPISLALLALGLVLITTVVALYYRHVAGFDRLTAVASALPGSLSSIPAIALQLGADGPRVAVAHALRVSLVVMLIPWLFMVWLGAEGDALSHAPTQWAIALSDAVIIAFAIPGWYVARLMRLPIPEMLGPMLIAASAAFMGYSFVLPIWLLVPTFIILGASIGSGFYGMKISELFNTGCHAFVATALLLLIALIMGSIVHIVADVPLPVALLSVTPAGVAEMALLASAMGIDPVFVTFHQVVRSLLLNSCAIFILSRFAAKKS